MHINLPQSGPVNRQCDMFTKELQSLDFLQAQLYTAQWKKTSHILWRLQCMIFINSLHVEMEQIWKLPAVIFNNSWFYVTITRTNYNVISVDQYCLPRILWNAKGHYFCKRTSHGLCIPPGSSVHGFQEGAVYYVGYFSLKERLISEKYKVP